MIQDTENTWEFEDAAAEDADVDGDGAVEAVEGPKGEDKPRVAYTFEIVDELPDNAPRGGAVSGGNPGFRGHFEHLIEMFTEGKITERNWVEVAKYPNRIGARNAYKTIAEYQEKAGRGEGKSVIPDGWRIEIEVRRPRDAGSSLYARVIGRV
jgi:hypothetical protein